MFLFCLGIKKAVADGLQVGGSDVKAVAIADDVTFIGPPDGRAAAEATEEFRKSCSSLGLILQGRKGKLLNFSCSPLHATTTALANRHGFLTGAEAAVLLVTPMVQIALRCKNLLLEIGRGDRIFEARRHPEMPDAQHYCRPNAPCCWYATDKLCRVGFCGEYSRALSKFEEQTQRAFAHIPEADPARMKISSSTARPLRHAGMALSKPSLVSHFAFFGAIANASYALVAAFPTALPRRFASAIRAAHLSVRDKVAIRLRDSCASS